VGVAAPPWCNTPVFVICIGGPHDGREMEIPDDGINLSFTDGATYAIEGTAAIYLAPAGESFGRRPR
jgi:hypothetical protein